MISEVTASTGQRVEYGYTYHPSPGAPCNPGAPGWYALTSAKYVDDLDPTTGLPIEATYIYTPHVACDSQYPNIPRGAGALLSEANDPRYDGPMRRIRYVFRGGPGGTPFDPQAGLNPQGGNNLNYFHMEPFPVEKELSAETGLMVSKLSIPGNADGNFHPEVGTRTETRGAGGSRSFYYGSSCGPEPGGPPINPSVGYRAYELGKVTEFADNPATAPYQFQKYSLPSRPQRIFDGRTLLTLLGWTDSGHVDAVAFRGFGTTDLALRQYDWTDSSGSAPQDFFVLPNPWKHWLFKKTDENGRITTYKRDAQRRVIEIDYHGGSFETFQYNEFNQVISHTLPSGATQTFVYSPTAQLLQEYDDVEGFAARKEYTYDALGAGADDAGRHRSRQGQDFQRSVNLQCAASGHDARIP